MDRSAKSSSLKMGVSEVSTSASTTMVVSPSVDPEDAELISQLAKLQQMHHQIHHLRTILPSALIGPARIAISQQGRTSPQAVAEAVVKAARQGSADIRDFQKHWHDEKTRQMFKEANAADTPQGVDAWMVDYEALVKSGPAVTAQPIEPQDESFDTAEQSRTSLEKQIGDTSSHLELSSGSAPGTFPLTIALGKMRFLINNDQAPRTYTIEAASNHRLAQKISEQLTKDGYKNSGAWKKLHDLLVRSVYAPQQRYQG